ncbi:MAG: DUF58 domain-containing protein [SAR202 cluster bacterium]|nr:DUF58 domain-containing protein [SAR202 cluster bacterium]
MVELQDGTARGMPRSRRNVPRFGPPGNQGTASPSALGEFWAVLFIVLLSVGFAARTEILVIIGGIGLAVAGGAWLWGRLAIERLTFQRTISRNRLFLNETATVSMAVTNRKRLPLARVRVVDNYPAGLDFQEPALKLSPSGETRRFVRSTSLDGYERVRWTYTLTPRQRGFYRLGPSEVETSDLFGFFPRRRRLDPDQLLLVFPATIPLPALPMPQTRPLGDFRGQAWFPIADSSRLAGIREYQIGDPTKFIDWKATARIGTVQVKQFEPGASALTALFLNADTVGATFGGVVPLHLERAVALAATLAEQILSQGQTVAVYTNSRSVMVDHPMRVPPARHPQQHALVMEVLGMVGPFLAGKIEDMLLQQARRLPAGTGLVLITAMMTPELARALEVLARLRRQPMVIWVASWEAEIVPDGVTFVDLSPHLAELEAGGQAPYFAGLEKRRGGGQSHQEDVQRQAEAAEQAHLEARNVPMA